MSLKRPSAKITVDGRALSAAEAGLVSLKIDLGLNGAHDAVQLQLWRASKFADATVGASLAIALGDAGSEDDVLTGEVVAVHSRPDHVVLEGLAATIALSRAYVSQSYVSQTVADIVKDLAGSAAVDKIDSDLQLGAYHVDNRRPAWLHLQMLAQLAGCDLAAAPDGSLRFVPAAGALQATRLRYGAELLDWDFAQAPAAAPPAALVHGAGSEQGSAKWHWLQHAPSSNGPSRVVGAFATKDAAEAASKALEGRAARTAVSGRIVIVGDAGIRPGDSVELADLPGANPGTLRVRAVHHRLDPLSGFTTRLSVEAADGGGPGL